MAENKRKDKLSKFYRDVIERFLNYTECWTNKESILPETIPTLLCVPGDIPKDKYYKKCITQVKKLEEHLDRYLKVVKKERSHSQVLQRFWQMKSNIKLSVQQSEGSGGAEKQMYPKHMQIFETIDDYLSKDFGSQKERESGTEIEKLKAQCQDSQQIFGEIAARLAFLQQKEEEKMETINCLLECRQNPHCCSTACREMQEKTEKLTAEMMIYNEQGGSFKNDQDSRMKSTVAGTTTKDNNLHLDDSNRPDLLEDRFRDLYENTWTNLIDTLKEETGEPDYVCIKATLDILQIIYAECKSQIFAQKKQMFNLIEYEQDEVHLSGPMKEHVKCANGLISDCGERMWGSVSKCVENKEKIGTFLKEGGEHRQSFISECIEICIKMCVQDPPVVLDFGHKSDEPFDRNCLHSFTDSGDIIDYLVWPAMYKNGMMMSKGIAQGKKKKSKTYGRTDAQAPVL